VAVDNLTIQQALFWMNLYRELLAVDESALLRMRALMAAEPANGRGDLYYMPDVELVMGEIERVRARLDFWLRHVDQLK
jgi:hypothetical protein